MAMMPSHHPLRAPAALRGDVDGDSLDALVHSSQRLRRFWPLLAAGPQESAPAGAGIRVSSGAQQLVAGMAEYGV